MLIVDFIVFGIFRLLSATLMVAGISVLLIILVSVILIVLVGAIPLALFNVTKEFLCQLIKR